MKNIIFEIRYYLLFLILFIGIFLYLIFSSENPTNSVNESFDYREIERSSIDLEVFSVGGENKQTSNRTQIIYVEKNKILGINKIGIENAKLSDKEKQRIIDIANKYIN